MPPDATQGPSPRGPEINERDGDRLGHDGTAPHRQDTIERPSDARPWPRNLARHAHGYVPDGRPRGEVVESGWPVSCRRARAHLAAAGIGDELVAATLDAIADFEHEEPWQPPRSRVAGWPPRDALGRPVRGR